jgi:hypothetical protein
MSERAQEERPPCPHCQEHCGYDDVMKGHRMDGHQRCPHCGNEIRWAGPTWRPVYPPRSWTGPRRGAMPPDIVWPPDDVQQVERFATPTDEVPEGVLKTEQADERTNDGE